MRSNRKRNATTTSGFMVPYDDMSWYECLTQVNEIYKEYITNHSIVDSFEFSNKVLTVVTDNNVLGFIKGTINPPDSTHGVFMQQLRDYLFHGKSISMETWIPIFSTSTNTGGIDNRELTRWTSEHNSPYPISPLRSNVGKNKSIPNIDKKGILNAWLSKEDGMRTLIQSLYVVYRRDHN